VADDASGGRLLAEHLAARGHRRIFYRAGDVSLVSAARRQAGFLEAAQEHDMTVTVQGPSLGGDLHEVLTEADVAWLDRPREERPTAAVCWNDLTAYNLLNHCRARGLSLPDDLAVAGYDDIPPPYATPWRLTTIRAPWAEVARTAVDVLVRSLGGEDIPCETVLPVTFVFGDTT
jgi:GntR family transcriptional regulator of arabinose operon